MGTEDREPRRGGGPAEARGATHAEVQRRERPLGVLDQTYEETTARVRRLQGECRSGTARRAGRSPERKGPDSL